MADGSTKQLDQVMVGDKVKATDPATGKTSGRTVIKVWINHDTDLMDVTATTNTWTEARHLKPGDRLRTSDGRAATVAATVVVSGDRDMWDLTVAADHDFYVATPVADVLVHNNSCRKFGFADAPRIAGVYTITLKRGNAYKVYVGASASNVHKRIHEAFTDPKSAINASIFTSDDIVTIGVVDLTGFTWEQIRYMEQGVINTHSLGGIGGGILLNRRNERQ